MKRGLLSFLVLITILVSTSGCDLFANLANKITTAGAKVGDQYEAYRTTAIWQCPGGLGADWTKWQKIYSCEIQSNLGYALPSISDLKVTASRDGEISRSGYVHIVGNKIQIQNSNGDILFYSNHVDGWISSSDIIRMPDPSNN